MSKIVRCKAVIFDFDGTLADSMPFLQKIGVKLMQEYFDLSKAEATRRYRSTTGLPYEQQIEMNFPDSPQNNQAIEEFERKKIQNIFEQDLFPDASDTVKTLHKKNFDLFVSSSTFESTIVEYFQRKSLLKYFKEIMGYRRGFEKGADHFMHVESQYDISLDEIVFIGDSLKDYERADGMVRFIAKEGMFTASDFSKIGHSGPVVTHLKQLPPLVELS
ncbi:MAG: HAD hydrolase-like protein [Candidatus Thorarchaeota archaeon]